MPSSDLPGFTLDPETFKKIQPLEYHRRFISQGIRPDGRQFMEFRSLNINTGNKNAITSCAGSSLVRLGETRVVCGLRVEVAEPLATEPKKGFLGKN